jgi:hypothetical protein
MNTNPVSGSAAARAPHGPGAWPSLARNLNGHAPALPIRSRRNGRFEETHIVTSTHVAPRIATAPRSRRLPLPLLPLHRPLPQTHRTTHPIPDGPEQRLCLHCRRLIPAAAIGAHLDRHPAITVRSRFLLHFRRRVLSLTEMQHLTQKGNRA